MSKTIERRTIVPIGEKITKVRIIDGGTNLEVFSIPDKTPKKYFSAGGLGLIRVDDGILNHKPKTTEEKE